MKDLQQRMLTIIERAERARSYGRAAFDVKNACLDDLIREAQAALAFVRCEPGEVVRAIEEVPAPPPAPISVRDLEQVKLWG